MGDTLGDPGNQPGSNHTRGHSPEWAPYPWAPPSTAPAVQGGLTLRPAERSACSGMGGSHAEAEPPEMDATSDVDFNEDVAQWHETEAMARDIQQVLMIE